jgi:hypothetical protein
MLIPNIERKGDVGQGFRNRFGSGIVTSEESSRRKSVETCTVSKPISIQ